MDRNSFQGVQFLLNAVALRKESVDRNSNSLALQDGACVALRKESVDRNVKELVQEHKGCVALRKESVDRNSAPAAMAVNAVMSLSARRAWIEIYL